MSLGSDLAVVRVKETLLFDQTVQPIVVASDCMPIEASVMVSILGFSTSLFTNQVHALTLMEVPTQDTHDCDVKYQSILEKGQVCAGYNDADTQDSHLPSYGDLMIYNGKLAGIVTYDTHCENTSMPAVLTDLTHHFYSSTFTIRSD